MAKRRTNRQKTPKVAVSRLVNNLKTVSSRMLRQCFPDIQKKYFKNALWTPSYFAGSCGGAPLETIKQYVQSQRTVNKRKDGLISPPFRTGFYDQ